MSEFSRPVALDAIGEEPREVAIKADADERVALARRFGWLTLDRLAACVTLTARAAGVDAEGTVEAALTQACVITGDPVPATLSEPFALRFVAPALIDPAEEEVELGGGDLDTVAHDGGAIDLGEAAAQTLALAVDPFPRGTRAEAALKEAGVGDETATGPFAALKGLLSPD